ncbi:hypothetical protein GQ44DRAFT_774455 [Phaeosphaeriaceae sp. PMI808]|nr:hypothetical protein GQ44DRAFT_774455 [Phaeosphaeriaceae sp. PMI808]
MAGRVTILNMTSWILLAIVVCIFAARFAMKSSKNIRLAALGFDDLFIILAALSSCGQTIVVSIESMKVLGQQAHSLTASQRDLFQKAEYAACILYITNMGCTRISVWLVIRKILRGTVPKYITLSLASFTGIWAISGVFVAAFPCNLPNSWNFLEQKMCYNRVAFVNYIAVTNIILDVLLVIIPLIIWDVQIPIKSRDLVALVFAARLSVVAAVSAQLYFLGRTDLSNYSFDYWAPVLCQQIAQSLTLICACFPCLHPFIVHILAGKKEPKPIECNALPWIDRYLGWKFLGSNRLPSPPSHTILSPLTEKISEPYCRPLATYDFDSASNHGQSNVVPHFRPNIARPIFVPRSPTNVFNRRVEVPQSRPGSSNSKTDPISTSPDISGVGLLPTIDSWDMKVEFHAELRNPVPIRHPTAEYVFNRQKVISVSEDMYWYDDGSKVFLPPLPSPTMPRWPPRCFDP